jgi:hypothetical protein
VNAEDRQLALIILASRGVVKDPLTPHLTSYSVYSWGCTECREWAEAFKAMNMAPSVAPDAIDRPVKEGRCDHCIEMGSVDDLLEKQGSGETPREEFTARRLLEMVIALNRS